MQVPSTRVIRNGHIVIKKLRKGSQVYDMDVIQTSKCQAHKIHKDYKATTGDFL